MKKQDKMFLSRIEKTPANTSSRMRMNDIPIKEMTNADNKEQDRELVRQVKQGYESAFNQLYHPLSEDIFNWHMVFFQDKMMPWKSCKETL